MLRNLFNKVGKLNGINTKLDMSTLDSPSLFGTKFSQISNYEENDVSMSFYVKTNNRTTPIISTKSLEVYGDGVRMNVNGEDQKFGWDLKPIKVDVPNYIRKISNSELTKPKVVNPRLNATVIGDVQYGFDGDISYALLNSYDSIKVGDSSPKSDYGSVTITFKLTDAGKDVTLFSSADLGDGKPNGYLEQFYLHYDSTDSKMKFKVIDYSSNESTATTVTMDEWHTVTLQWYNMLSDEPTSGIKLFYDGNLEDSTGLALANGFITTPYNLELGGYDRTNDTNFFIAKFVTFDRELSVDEINTLHLLNTNQATIETMPEGEYYNLGFESVITPKLGNISINPVYNIRNNYNGYLYFNKSALDSFILPETDALTSNSELHMNVDIWNLADDGVIFEQTKADGTYYNLAVSSSTILINSDDGTLTETLPPQFSLGTDFMKLSVIRNGADIDLYVDTILYRSFSITGESVDPFNSVYLGSKTDGTLPMGMNITEAFIYHNNNSVDDVNTIWENYSKKNTGKLPLKTWTRVTIAKGDSLQIFIGNRTVGTMNNDGFGELTRSTTDEWIGWNGDEYGDFYIENYVEYDKELRKEEVKMLGENEYRDEVEHIGPGGFGKELGFTHDGNAGICRNSLVVNNNIWSIGDGYRRPLITEYDTGENVYKNVLSIDNPGYFKASSSAVYDNTLYVLSACKHNPTQCNYCCHAFFPNTIYKMDLDTKQWSSINANNSGSGNCVTRGTVAWGINDNKLFLEHRHWCHNRDMLSYNFDDNNFTKEPVSADVSIYKGAYHCCTGCACSCCVCYLNYAHGSNDYHSQGSGQYNNKLYTMNRNHYSCCNSIYYNYTNCCAGPNYLHSYDTVNKVYCLEHEFHFNREKFGSKTDIIGNVALVTGGICYYNGSLYSNNSIFAYNLTTGEENCFVNVGKPKVAYSQTKAIGNALYYFGFCDKSTGIDYRDKSFVWFLPEEYLGTGTMITPTSQTNYPGKKPIFQNHAISITCNSVNETLCDGYWSHCVPSGTDSYYGYIDVKNVGSLDNSIGRPEYVDIFNCASPCYYYYCINFYEGCCNYSSCNGNISCSYCSSSLNVKFTHTDYQEICAAKLYLACECPFYYRISHAENNEHWDGVTLASGGLQYSKYFSPRVWSTENYKGKGWYTFYFQDGEGYRCAKTLQMSNEVPFSQYQTGVDIINAVEISNNDSKYKILHENSSEASSDSYHWYKLNVISEGQLNIKYYLNVNDYAKEEISYDHHQSCDANRWKEFIPENPYVDSIYTCVTGKGEYYHRIFSISQDKSYCCHNVCCCNVCGVLRKDNFSVYNTNYCNYCTYSGNLIRYNYILSENSSEYTFDLFESDGSTVPASSVINGIVTPAEVPQQFLTVGEYYLRVKDNNDTNEKLKLLFDFDGEFIATSPNIPYTGSYGAHTHEGRVHEKTISYIKTMGNIYSYLCLIDTVESDANKTDIMRDVYKCINETTTRSSTGGSFVEDNNYYYFMNAVGRKDSSYCLCVLNPHSWKMDKTTYEVSTLVNNNDVQIPTDSQVGIYDNKIFMYGGRCQTCYNGHYDRLITYDILADTEVCCGPVVYFRNKSTQIGQELYMVCYTCVFKFDLAAPTTKIGLGTIPESVYNGVTYNIGNYLYAVGGNGGNIQKYNMTDNTSETLVGNFPKELYCINLYDDTASSGNYYIYGGTTNPSENGCCHCCNFNANIFSSPDGETWTQLDICTRMPVSQSRVMILDNKYYLTAQQWSNKMWTTRSMIGDTFEDMFKRNEHTHRMSMYLEDECDGNTFRAGLNYGCRSLCGIDHTDPNQHYHTCTDDFSAYFDEGSTDFEVTKTARCLRQCNTCLVTLATNKDFSTGYQSVYSALQSLRFVRKNCY